jgi:hypothetical protein
MINYLTAHWRQSGLKTDVHDSRSPSFLPFRLLPYFKIWGSRPPTPSIDATAVTASLHWILVSRTLSTWDVHCPRTLQFPDETVRRYLLPIAESLLAH